MEASPINQRHPDDEAGKDEADLFFEEPEDENGNGEATEATAAEPEGTAVEHEPSEPESEPEAEAAAEPAAKDEPPADPPTPPAASAGPTEGEEAKPEPATRGSVDRTYVVLQRIPLTKRALEHLLKEIEERGGDPRVAYMEVARPVKRNDRQAIGDTYRKEKTRLGATPTMVAVSERAFKERKVRPKEQPVKETVEIS